MSANQNDAVIETVPIATSSENKHFRAESSDAIRISHRVLGLPENFVVLAIRSP